MQKWLKEIRQKKGYTQKSIASKVGIAKTTYSSYEQGHRQPSVNSAKKIAEVLEIPWTIFFDHEVLESYLEENADSEINR